MAWYREWFGEEYLELYAHRDGEEAEVHAAFVVERLVPARPRAVLDLACGTGRHAAALARRGYRAIGVDLSLTLLGRGAALPRVRGDMRTLPFAAGAFDWVLNVFTSFGYFEREAENERVLAEIARVLVPGGTLLLDLMNRDQVVATLSPHETQEIDGGTVEIDRHFDATRQRLEKRIRVTAPGRPTRSWLESVRAYRDEEITASLAAAGLSVTARFGSFSGAPYGRASERLILLARRDA